ncbi:MAG: molybdate ABC transporter permease subunit [Planctomycetota bacterium]|jgi:molybdate transport system permease protein
MLSPEEWTTLALSAQVALVACVVLAVPGVALGYLLARGRFPGKAVIEAIVYLPMVLPPVVTGYLLLHLLGPRSLVGSWIEHLTGLRLAFSTSAAVLAAAVMALPLLVRAARLSFEAVDQGLEQAAATCGAAPWDVFRSVTLPLAVPGISAGLILAFARSLGEFGATVTLAGNLPGETRTLALAVYTAMQQPGGDAGAVRLVLISAVFAVAALIGSEWLARRWRAQP